MRLFIYFPLLFAVLATVDLCAADSPFDRTADVIYGRKFGTALTMDVFRPKEKANGLGIIFVVSGGWFSGREADGHRVHRTAGAR